MLESLRLRLARLALKDRIKIIRDGSELDTSQRYHHAILSCNIIRVLNYRRETATAHSQRRRTTVTLRDRPT